MSDLTDLRDHARERSEWQPGPKRAACKVATPFGTSKPADHANCGGYMCGCECHQPTESERRLWLQIAGEIDAYLTPEDDDGPDLFGGGD